MKYVDVKHLYMLMSFIYDNYGAVKGAASKGWVLNILEVFGGLPEKEVVIIFLEGERLIVWIHYVVHKLFGKV